MIILAILLLCLIVFLSLDLLITGLQVAIIMVCAPFVFIYHLLKVLFSKGKKANES